MVSPSMETVAPKGTPAGRDAERNLVVGQKVV